MTLVLGIESSCDETAAAVVRNGDQVLSNVVHSQVRLHTKYRGVVPEIASRSHTTRILPVIQAALEEARTQAQDLDAVAVTNRPGMVGCLLVGTAAAKALSWIYQLPLIGVDHIQAHIHAAFMTRPDMALPALALVASGGHTALYLVAGPGNAQRIGATRDDAAGEALDKGAALLGLPYPGGPAIQEAARAGNTEAVSLPRPLGHKDQGLDFSFSGIKTALLYHLRGNGLTRPLPTLTATEVKDLAASYQAAIVDCLVTKLDRAIQEHGARALSVGGGVARNERLREQIRNHEVLGRLQLVFPPPELCSDNAAMVAGLGTLFLVREQVDDLHLEVAATTTRKPR
jgi:tRNA N6-adenosine threonylcarbamoyltransferase